MEYTSFDFIEEPKSERKFSWKIPFFICLLFLAILLVVIAIQAMEAQNLQTKIYNAKKENEDFASKVNLERIMLKKEIYRLTTEIQNHSSSFNETFYNDLMSAGEYGVTKSMKEDAKDFAIFAMKNYSSNFYRARYIKQEFDKKYPKFIWSCTVGHSFKSFFAYHTTFLFFHFKDVHIEIWNTNK